MDHIQDVYKKKPEMINKIWDHLTKVNLKVDGKPFQVVYNEEEDELEYHGRSGNETKVGPLIDDMQRLFSKPINDAIRHIEKRVDVFKRYKFLTFEVISEILLLTAIIDKDGNFIDNPDEIDKIAKELDTDVMPCLWKGKLSDEQRDTLMNTISSDIIPTKGDFIKWVKGLFGTYEKFPKSLISRSNDFIEGLVFFYEVDGKVVEYKLVDPSYAQSVKDNQLKSKQDAEKNAEVFNEIYTTFVNWGEENGKALDKNRMRSIEFNFIEMMKDPKIYNKLMKDGAYLTTKTTDAYFLQLDRVSEELRKAIRKHGKVYQLLYEIFIKLFYKAKKRAFVVSQDFQARVNKLVEKFADYSLNEDEIEIDGIFMLNEDKIDNIKTYIKNTIDKETKVEKLEKIDNYISSLNKDNKNILFNWCKLKYNDKRRSEQFYKLLKTALRKTSSFTKFINFIKYQMNDDYTKLKTPSDNAFIELDLTKNNESINIDNLIYNAYDKKFNIDKSCWTEIHNISLPGQPTVGNSEILFRIITHPGLNNKMGGDVPMYDHGVEIKDFGKTEAKLGNDKFGNTKPIFDFLQIPKDIGALNNSTLKDLIYDIKINPNNFEEIFNKYIDEEIVKELKDKVIDDLNNSLKEKNTSFFRKIWFAFYLIGYAKSENFDVFLTTNIKKQNCFSYSSIFINLNKIKETYDYILKQDNIICTTIRNDSVNKIIITTANKD